MILVVIIDFVFLSRLIGSIMLDGACPSSCYERSHKGLLVAEALILFLEEQ